MPAIAIDLGTSFIKGAVLDTDRLTVERVRRVPFPDPVPGLPPGYVETDPGEIVAAVRSLVEALLSDAGECSGLFVCNQMSSLVLVDSSGKALSNCIGWRDQRATRPHPSGGGIYLDVLGERITQAQRDEMGNEFRAELALSFLFCLSEKGNLPRGAFPASIGDFVLSALCHTRPCADITNASALGLLHLKTLDWHRPVIERLGLDVLNWPKVVPANEVVGHLEAGGRRIPCYVAVGDQQAAMAGTLVEERELWLNISTGSQASLLTTKPEAGDFRVRPTIDGRYYRTITHIPAGRSLTVLVDLLTELTRAQGREVCDPWPYLAAAAETVEETDLDVDLAFFAGPCGDRGKIANIREGNLTAGHLFRAALQNMADNYHACALRLSPGMDWDRLAMSGGLPQKFPLLRDLISRRFGMGYRLPPTEEDTLFGLLVLAVVCTGRASTLVDASALLRHGTRED